MSLATIIALMASRRTGWNPADKNTRIVLTNANLTAAASGTSPTGLEGVRANVHKTAGKWYFELTADANADTNTNGNLGLFPASTSVSASDPTPGAITFQPVNGAISINGADSGVSGWSGLIAQGDTISIAVDMTARRFWLRRNAGNWNNNAAANPATGANGVSFSALSSSVALYPGLWIQDAGAGAQKYTANFGVTAFAETVPSGFGAWR
jgi:hypothetical protein